MVSWIRGEPKLIPIKQKKHSSQTSHSMNFFNLFKMQFYLFIFGELYLSEPRFVCIAMRAGVTNRFGCYCRPNENKSWNTAFTFRTDTGLRSGLLADLVWLAGFASDLSLAQISVNFVISTQLAILSSCLSLVLCWMTWRLAVIVVSLQRSPAHT